jgi:hypothetical protein
MDRLLVVPLLALAALPGCATYDTDYSPAPAAAVPATAPAPSVQIVSRPAEPAPAPASGAILAVPRVSVAAPYVPASPPPAVYRIGSGLIESIAAVRAPLSSIGGASSQSGVYRLVVRMDDGSVQVLDQNSRSFLVGDRVQLTADGRISRL